MAERVIDDFELIEVEVQQCVCLFGIAAKHVQPVHESVFKLATIDQIRQRVV